MFQWDVRALEILDTLERAGHQAVLVGGCVRDALLGREPHDYDAAVSAPPEEILAACRSKFKCIPTGLAHGTVTVVHGGLPVEVTAFRKEGTYSDHRHPDRVAYTSRLEEDLARRDFTVNAMAWGRSGLTDPFGGQADLAAGVIRCVGDPDRRFQEDALRVLRGLRLAAQLDFRLEGETAAAIRRNTPLLSYVAWERIQAEFLRLLCCPGAERILLDFPETVCQIVPELTPAVGFDQKNPHHCYDVYTHSVKALGQVRPEPALRLAALLHDAGKPACFSLDEQGVGHFYGHEGESARLAEQAAARNGLADRLIFRRGDLRKIRGLLPAGGFDLVVCNPPYYPAGSGRLPETEALRAARSETGCTLEDICTAAAWLLRWGGSFCLVHKPERLADLCCALRARGLEPKRLRLVCRRAGDAPSLLLLEARRGGRPGLDIAAPLCLEDGAGRPTAELDAIYFRTKETDP